MMGARIKTLRGLKRAVKNRRAVTTPGFGSWRKLPAAVVLNFSGSQLLKMFESGIYLYKKKGKSLGEQQ